jgi:hypothetical protein
MMETRYVIPQDDRTPLAIAAGLVAALVGGGIWAAIVLITSFEVGWAAWGIGFLVGLAMARTTINRSRALALTAAALAVLGLVAGKALVTTGSPGVIADHLVENPEYLEGALAWQMYDADELAPATMAAIDATDAAGDTLSDALWAEMVGQASDRLAGMSQPERRELAEASARAYVSQMTVADRLTAQFSGFDALWILLAVGTAFRVMDGRPEEQVVVEDEADAREPVAVGGGSHY